MVSRNIQDTPQNRSLAGEGVLVTGCSSGIGRATAIHLARQGFAVFATVRKQDDVEALQRLNEPNLVPTYPLDLAKPEHIPHVVEFVTQELRLRGKQGLYAIVNNAGGSFIAPVELTDLDKFRTELETRILGPMALLQALLPMIRQAQGRVAWIATPALIPVPYVSSIHACDFAVNCIVRTLRIELAPWGIPITLIRCGGIRTAATGENAPKPEVDLKKRWPAERFELYSQALAGQLRQFAEFDAKRTEPEEVAKVVYAALSARKPRQSYAVGHMARTAGVLELLPHSIADWIIARRSA
jgi:NAD(P)-dependent dehydrogenase (short-subunit alcohol dehydrogenase family)